MFISLAYYYYVLKRENGVLSSPLWVPRVMIPDKIEVILSTKKA